MAFIIEVKNAFDPLRDTVKHIHPGGTSIREWLESTYPGFVEFPVATICLVNGEAVKREGWNREIKKNDIVNFITLPGEPVTIGIIIAIVLVMILVVVVYVVTTTPTTPGETPAGDPVFTIRGQQNTIRMGEPIEACYGRNRIYPAVAARHYFQYVDNDQFQFSLFCLGHGSFSIDSIKIGDTEIDEYEEVQYEILQPGDPITLFPSNVYTSIEAGGQTLFASNEVEYIAPGWVGAFSACPPGTTCTKIELDLVLPKGLYRIDKKGKLKPISVNYWWQARLINDVGAPLGDWVTLSNSGHFTAASTTPQRRTISHAVDEGRWEVRIKRTNEKNLDLKAGNDLVLEGMKSFLRATSNYGDVTLLAVKIRATNNLNSTSQRQFNVLATRKIPVYAAGVWTEAVSRSIVWAFVDVFKSTYGGRVEEDVFFDLEALEDLDALYTSRGEYFDWVFRDPITVWDAARAIARAGRAVPLLVGSLITMKRDGPLTVPVTLFTPDNMRKGSFSWEVKLWDLVQNDSIRVEYTEPSTGYKQEQVLATLPGGTTDNPRNVRLAGVQSRAHAYHEAMYMLASERYVRENISFETGLEGYIPSFGDLIAVAHDVPRWGQSGFIVHAVAGVGTLWTLWLSETLDWSQPGVHQLVLRKKNSDILGPFTAVRTTDDSQVVVDIPGSPDFLLGGNTEPMLFLFGITGSVTKYARIVQIEPRGGEGVRILAVNDAPVVHTYDLLSPPALGSDGIPDPEPDLPIVLTITLVQIDIHYPIVLVSWAAAVGARYYVVESSTDGIVWQEEGTTIRTSIQIQTVPGSFWARVAGVNSGQGPWAEGTLDVKYFLELTLFLPWEDDEWGVSWNSVSGADDYIIKVYDNTGVSPVLKSTITQPNTSFIYTYLHQQDDDNLVTEMLVIVDARFEGEGEGEEPRSLEVSKIPSGVLTMGALPSGDYVVDVPVLINLEATGGTLPYSWDLAPGSDPLPPGVEIAGDVMQGPPNTLGLWNLIIRVTDGVAATDDEPLAMNIIAAPDPLIADTLPSGDYPVDTYFSHFLSATGGTLPYSWDLAPGSDPLPPGLVIATGVLLGTPTVVGMYNLIFRVTDEMADYDDEVFNMNIIP